MRFLATITDLCPGFCLIVLDYYKSVAKAKTNRNYFTVVFHLARDKLVPQIISTAFLLHISTKGRNVQPLCLLFWCSIQIKHFWETELKIREHEHILIFHEIKFQGPEIKDRQIASDIGREISIAALDLMDSTHSFSETLLLATVMNCLIIRWAGQPDIVSAQLSSYCI